MKMFDAGKTRMIGLPYGEKNCDDMLSGFHLIPECFGQTDGQICYINIGYDTPLPRLPYYYWPALLAVSS